MRYEFFQGIGRRSKRLNARASVLDEESDDGPCAQFQIACLIVMSWADITPPNRYAIDEATRDPTADPTLAAAFTWYAYEPGGSQVAFVTMPCC